jgi:uncharacterized protein (TIGR00369 family)
MKKIRNPFLGKAVEEYHCFGCSPNNGIGLHLEFFDNGDGLVAFWQPNELLQGYHDVVHGGIQATLMDEIAAWTVYVKCKTAGVTTKMEVDLLNPLRISKGVVSIAANVVDLSEKSAVIKTEIIDSEGKKCAEGLMTYFLYPASIATRKFGYPGVEAFYD